MDEDERIDKRPREEDDADDSDVIEEDSQKGNLSHYLSLLITILG
jgi:hypothetical protein